MGSISPGNSGSRDWGGGDAREDRVLTMRRGEQAGEMKRTSDRRNGMCRNTDAQAVMPMVR